MDRRIDLNQRIISFLLSAWVGLICGGEIEIEAQESPPQPAARMVINWESWGIYVNSQQFNREFMRDWFGTTKPARWKMPGNQWGDLKLPGRAGV